MTRVKWSAKTRFRFAKKWIDCQGLISFLLEVRSISDEFHLQKILHVFFYTCRGCTLGIPSLKSTAYNSIWPKTTLTQYACFKLRQALETSYLPAPILLNRATIHLGRWKILCVSRFSYQRRYCRHFTRKLLIFLIMELHVATGKWLLTATLF